MYDRQLAWHEDLERTSACVRVRCPPRDIVREKSQRSPSVYDGHGEWPQAAFADRTRKSSTARRPSRESRECAVAGGGSLE